MLIQICNFFSEIFFSYVYLFLSSSCSFFISTSQSIGLILNPTLINYALSNVLICFLSLILVWVFLGRIANIIKDAIFIGAGIGSIGVASGVLPPGKGDDDEDKQRREEEAKEREEEAKRAEGARRAAWEAKVQSEVEDVHNAVNKLASDIVNNK
jgi:hypothetical protein